ncbi:hypothetical protein BU23DRAFT_557038 [Bimuria novae-zelandiae CBS 107.79]|uniref:ER membrane protein complex subunit 7 beta-sandwich domain-containing protein n=1 Tax=Bimuria novae-zelandiae CBS 107.79 TaxID=1447943 RepID=A0A6A5UZH0_9PLEO|nr:hypothetical protein BU23DRAFT_557038 [Bimuria novae-zelandiae CBS 107.79]
MRSSTAALACLVSVTSAARFILHIPNTPLVNPSSFPSTTHATLQSTGAPLDAYITRSNSFNFHNVSVGSYLATIHSRDYVFEPLRIDVTLEEEVEGSGHQREKVHAWQTFIGNEWDNKGETRGEGGNGLVIDVQPRAPKQYYQERAGFSPVSFLKNPMILMGLFTLIMVFGMPYLMENMDPETKAEFEEMQKKGVMGSGSTQTAQQIQNFDLASWMAGKTETPTRGQSPAPQSQGKKRG